MPWSQTHIMKLRVQMIADHLSKNFNPTELARIYGVSRKTIYKWIERFEQDPERGLVDRSRAPIMRPHAVPEPVKQAIIDTKLKYPHLGPRKVMNHLRRQHPESYWPVNSTAGAILASAGLVRPRRHKSRVAPNVVPFAACDASNSVWSADYKGDFRLGDHTRCYPLTVSDNFSRYLLACQGLPNTGYEHAKAVFERLFIEYGLPLAIRIDNGAPFASTALGGLSRLSTWWVELGIRPERIEKGKPNQNGRHERMHRSLKDAAINPARYSLKAQQQVFDQYREQYNHIRSHEALNDRVPNDVYHRSMRTFAARRLAVEYDHHYVVRRVRHNGEVKWQGQVIYVSQVLAKQPIGFKQISETRWSVYYGFYQLGYWNQIKKKLEPVRANKSRQPPPPSGATASASAPLGGGVDNDIKQ